MLAAPVSARKRRPSRKLVRTLGQRREGAIFYRPSCSWCGKPKARETDDSCTRCAAELDRLAKRAKMESAPLLAYFALVAEVVRKHWFPKVNASALAAFYIKQGGLCAITGNPMTIDPKDPAAASPFPEWDDWGRMQFFGIACKSAASAQAQRFAKHRV